jgi:hypothetical protein
MLFMLNFLFVKVCKHLIILVNELGEKLITYREGVKDGRVIGGGENVPRARLHSNPKKAVVANKTIVAAVRVCIRFIESLSLVSKELFSILSCHQLE